VLAPKYWPGEFAPVEDIYAGVDWSGEILAVAVVCEAGSELPALAIPDQLKSHSARPSPGPFADGGIFPL
jgi:hypothetical protein